MNEIQTAAAVNKQNKKAVAADEHFKIHAQHALNYSH